MEKLSGVLGLQALFTAAIGARFTKKPPLPTWQAPVTTFRAGRNEEKRKARAEGAPYGLRVKLYSGRRLRQRQA